MEKEYQTNEKLLKMIARMLVLAMILSVMGVGFGVYGTIQANRALSSLEKIENEAETEIEFTYGKPASVDEIEYVSISYNKNKDYIDFYDGEIEYYTKSDEIDSVLTNEGYKEALQYIFDYALEYLGDNDVLKNETWSIEIGTANHTYSYASGEAEAPEWFKNLLNKLDVNNKGYLSEKS